MSRGDDPLDLAHHEHDRDDQHDDDDARHLDAVSHETFPEPDFEDEFVPKVERVKNDSLSNSGVKRRRKISLETKLEILQRLEANEKVCDICRDFGLASSTVCTINGQAHRIRAKAKALSNKRVEMAQLTHGKGGRIVEEMEKQLYAWIREQNSFPVGRTLGAGKSQQVYEDIADPDPVETQAEVPDAGPVWFSPERSSRHESRQSRDAEPMVCDCVHLQQLIESGGYAPEQVFTVSETALLWKSLPETLRAFIEGEGVPPRPRINLVLGCNAAGDMKLKPLMVYRSESPAALKGYARTRLPVIWRANKRAVVTQTLFEEWFSLYFCPAVEHFCTQKNIPHKALLVLSDSACHPSHLNELSEHVRVEFLPESSALFQPMEQGILSEFKIRYLQKAISDLLMREIDDISQIRDYWENFDILNAIDNVASSWDEISSHTINIAWRTIWPDCVTYFDEVKDLPDMQGKLVEIVREIGFRDVKKKDISDWLALHDQPASAEELAEMERTSDIEDDDQETQPLRQLSVSLLAEAKKHIEKGLEIYNRQDPHRERSSKVIRLVHQAVQCYHDIYREKQKRNAQNLLTQHFCAGTSPGAPSQKPPAPKIAVKKQNLSLADCCTIKNEEETITFSY